MGARSVFVTDNSSPEEKARIEAIRRKYRREKPTPKQALAASGHTNFIPLGQLLTIHHFLSLLKKERERQKLTLAALGKKTGIAESTLSKLENGKQDNPTFFTLIRYADALGKQIVYGLQDVPKMEPTSTPQKKRHRAAVK